MSERGFRNTVAFLLGLLIAVFLFALQRPPQPPGQLKKTPTPTATPAQTPTPPPTPTNSWAKLYGSICNEALYRTIPASDGGFVSVGYTCSYNGSYDGLFVKTDESGNVTRTVVHGSADRDEAVWDIAPLPGGGYIFVGDFDPQYVAVPTPPGGSDVWVGKLDANLNLLPGHKTFGGAGKDLGRNISLTTGGGFLVVGSTESFGAGAGDVWVLLLGSDLSLQFQRAFGTPAGDMGLYGLEIPHGYLIVGESGGDALVARVSHFGDFQYAFAFGGSGIESFNHAHEIAGGGYVFSGTTSSYGAGGVDAFALKVTDETLLGTAWQFAYGTSQDDRSIAYSLHATPNGSFIFGGQSADPSRGFRQPWAMLISNAGQPTASKRYTLATETNQDVYSIQGLSDGGFAFGGSHNYGLSFDSFIVRTSPDLSAPGAADWPIVTTPTLAARRQATLSSVTSTAVPVNRQMSPAGTPPLTMTSVQ